MNQTERHLMKTNVAEAFSGEMQLPVKSEAELRIL
jgi:hypothetical protein